MSDVFQNIDPPPLASVYPPPPRLWCVERTHSLDGEAVGVNILEGQTKGVGPGPTLAWPGWKQPDIPVEVDTDRLETSRSEAGVLKKLSLAGIAKLSRLKYR